MLQKSLTLIILFILLIACSEETIEPTHNYRLQLVSGNDQTGQANRPLSEPVVLRVTDESGTPARDIQIFVEITEGEGQILNDNLVTNNEGFFELDWQLGIEYENVLSVRIENSTPIIINATTLFAYTIPQELNDGWDIAELDTSNGRSQNLFNAMDQIRSGRYSEIHSCLIVHQGKLVFETYFPGHNSNGEFIEYDNTSVHEIQSAYKSFRSMLIGIAIDKEYIPNVNVSVFDFFPDLEEYRNNGRENISLEHALTMSSGLDWNEWDVGYDEGGNSLMEMNELGAGEWPEFVLSQNLANTPGSTFLYNSGLAQCLTHIITNATNQSMDDFARENYWNIIGGNPDTEFTFFAKWTPRDMARLGQVYLNGGTWKDTRIVSEEWVNASLQPKFDTGMNASEYGYQWWIRDILSSSSESYNAFYANGNGGQFIIGIKELELVIVFTGGNFNSNAMFEPFDIVSRYILPTFGN